MGFPVFINKVQEDLESFIGKVFEDEVVDLSGPGAESLALLIERLRSLSLNFLLYL